LISNYREKDSNGLEKDHEGNDKRIRIANNVRPGESGCGLLTYDGDWGKRKPSHEKKKNVGFVTSQSEKRK